jgi:hypothetical protein
MRRRKLRRGVYWQWELNKKGEKQVGCKNGYVYFLVFIINCKDYDDLGKTKRYSLSDVSASSPSWASVNVRISAVSDVSMYSSWGILERLGLNTDGSAKRLWLVET